jgi:YHS domain-containing protein
MMLTCVACRKTFTREDPVTVYLSDDGMYFFCNRECKENWLYSEEEAMDSEVIGSRTEYGA